MSRRTLAILLALSVALNLFVVGAVAGGWWMRERLEIRRTPTAATPALGWRAMGRRLSPEGREVFRETLRDLAPETAPLAAEGRRNRREAAELMAAPTLDAAALGAALDRARAADVKLRGKLEGAVVDAAARLTPGDRAVLSENLRRRAQRPNRPGREKVAPPAPEPAPPAV